MTTIYTDGASRGNPGRGGYGAIIVDESEVTEVRGKEEQTTNNRMEMKGAIEALKQVSQRALIEVHTDSSYLLNGITKWVYGWQKNGWITKNKEEVLNKDLWLELVNTLSNKKVEWQKVTGHSGHSYNDRCDIIATSFADDKPLTLFKGSLTDYQESW